ncbi:hypothetical protein FRB97_008016 [Tulasnella sp. 331]|nr:hypothetical protein FRB97_008016 [Tulasnella sp. 331]
MSTEMLCYFAQSAALLCTLAYYFHPDLTCAAFRAIVTLFVDRQPPSISFQSRCPDDETSTASYVIQSPCTSGLTPSVNQPSTNRPADHPLRTSYVTRPDFLPAQDPFAFQQGLYRQRSLRPHSNVSPPPQYYPTFAIENTTPTRGLGSARRFESFQSSPPRRLPNVTYLPPPVIRSPVVYPHPQPQNFLHHLSQTPPNTTSTVAPVYYDTTGYIAQISNATPAISTTTATLNQQLISKLLTTTPAPGTELLFRGACVVAWDGPSGVDRSESLSLAIGRFVDTSSGRPINTPVFTFTQGNTSGASFTVLDTLPSQRIDDVPSFPFRLQRVGADSQHDVVIAMIEDVAWIFCQITGLAFPRANATLPPPYQSPSATSLLSQSPPSSFIPPSSSTSALPPSSQPATLNFTSPISDHIYESPCRHIINGTSQKSCLYFRRVKSASGTMEWQFALPPASRGKKRDWFSIISDGSHWRRKVLDGEEPGRRILVSGINVKSRQVERATILLSEAFATRFCDWTGLSEASSNRKLPLPARSDLSTSSPPLNPGWAVASPQSLFAGDSSAPAEDTDMEDGSSAPTDQDIEMTTSETEPIASGVSAFQSSGAMEIDDEAME